MKRFSLVVLATAAFLLCPRFVRADDFPPGDAHDIVAKACAQCHDAGMVTSQQMTAARWSDTVRQMISSGAQITKIDFDRVVAYLAKNCSVSADPSAHGSQPPRSKNDVPYYAPLVDEGLRGTRT